MTGDSVMVGHYAIKALIKCICLWEDELRLPRQSYFWHYLYFLQLTLQPTHSRIITACCGMKL